MHADRDAVPDEVAALKKALAVERAKGLEIAAELAVARAKASEDEALIAQQKLQIAKLRHQIYGQRSERSARLIEQLALTFEELEADATEDELAAERAVAKTTTVRGFTRKRAERQTFPEHLPRERVVIDGPTACECCGSNRLRKLGEEVTRTLEVVPRQWKVVETVREKFSCRDCEKISQAPAPFHAIARGWAGPSLLAMIMFEKFGQHQPLNRQNATLWKGCRLRCRPWRMPWDRFVSRWIPCCAASKPMSWRPSAFTPMIRPFRCWPRERPTRAVGRCRAAGSDVLLLPRPQGRASPEASGPICRYPAGRRL